MMAPLTDSSVKLLFPDGATKYDFPGSCGLGLPPPRRNLTGLLPDYVIDMLPPKICLPPGDLWYTGQLPVFVNDPTYNWPNRTVLIPPKTIILPPGAGRRELRARRASACTAPAQHEHT